MKPKASIQGFPHSDAKLKCGDWNMFGLFWTTCFLHNCGRDNCPILFRLTNNWTVEIAIYKLWKYSKWLSWHVKTSNTVFSDFFSWLSHCRGFVSWIEQALFNRAQKSQHIYQSESRLFSSSPSKKWPLLVVQVMTILVQHYVNFWWKSEVQPNHYRSNWNVQEGGVAQTFQWTL